jgi:hypothetical protein
MLNCTVPAGTDDPVVGTTVAVKVTLWLKMEGLELEDRLVVVATAPMLIVPLPVFAA